MVERYRRQVDERSTPSAFGRAYGGPEVYGAGVGRAMGPLGDAIARLAEYKQKRQDEWDAATVMNAQNEYMKRLSEWMDDPEKGQAANRKLGAARGLADDAYQYADALAEDITGQLENDAQKAAFMRISENARLPFWKGASEYEARQVRDWQDQTFATAMATSADLVTRSPGDAFALETAREQRHNAIRARLFGAAPETVERALAESDSELDERRFSILAKDDPVGALAMVRGENALLPEARAKMETALAREVEALEQKAQAEAEAEYVHTAADAYWGEFVDDDQAAWLAMEDDPNMSPEMRERAWAKYKARLADLQRWDAQRERDWSNGWLDKIADSRNMEEALSYIEASGADGQARIRFEGYAAQVHRTGGFKEDIEDWAQAFQEVTTGQIQTADDFLARWRGRLSEGSLKSLYRTFFEGGGGSGSGGGGRDAEYVGFSFSDAVRDAMKSVRIHKDSSPEAARFVTVVGDEIEAQRQKLGRKLTPLEKDKILQDMTKSYTMKNKKMIFEHERRYANRMGFMDLPGYGMVREVLGADGAVTYEQFDPSASYDPPAPEPKQPPAPLPPLPERGPAPTGQAAPQGRSRPRVRIMPDGTPFDRGRPSPRRGGGSSPGGGVDVDAGSYDGYTRWQRTLESGGRADAVNAKSGATGADQFIGSTWLGWVKKLKPAWADGKSDAEILEMRKDPHKSAEIKRAFDANNAKALRRAGLPVTYENLYACHHFGAGGGTKFARASMDTRMEDLFKASWIKANPYLKGKTKAQTIANWRKRAGRPPQGA